MCKIHCLCCVVGLGIRTGAEEVLGVVVEVGVGIGLEWANVMVPSIPPPFPLIPPYFIPPHCHPFLAVPRIVTIFFHG